MPASKLSSNCEARNPLTTKQNRQQLLVARHPPEATRVCVPSIHHPRSWWTPEGRHYRRDGKSHSRSHIKPGGSTGRPQAAPAVTNRIMSRTRGSHRIVGGPRTLPVHLSDETTKGQKPLHPYRGGVVHPAWDSFFFSYNLDAHDRRRHCLVFFIR